MIREEGQVLVSTLSMPSCIGQLLLCTFGVVGTIVPFLLISSKRRNHGRGYFFGLSSSLRRLGRGRW